MPPPPQSNNNKNMISPKHNFQKIGPIFVRRTGLRFAVGVMVFFFSLGPFAFDPGALLFPELGRGASFFGKLIAYAATYTATYNAAGTYTWNAPVGVATATIETWGAGGGGGGV